MAKLSILVDGQTFAGAEEAMTVVQLTEWWYDGISKVNSVKLKLEDGSFLILHGEAWKRAVLHVHE